MRARTVIGAATIVGATVLAVACKSSSSNNASSDAGLTEAGCPELPCATPGFDFESSCGWASFQTTCTEGACQGIDCSATPTENCTFRMTTNDGASFAFTIDYYGGGCNACPNITVYEADAGVLTASAAASLTYTCGGSDAGSDDAGTNDAASANDAGDASDANTTDAGSD